MGDPGAQNTHDRQEGVRSMITAELTRTELTDTEQANTELQAEELTVLPDRLETTGCWNGCWGGWNGGWGGWGW